MPRPKVVLGCPCSNRAWVLPSWIQHTLQAAQAARLIAPEYVFVIPQRDYDSLRVIERDLVDRARVSLILTEEEPRDAQRDWNRPERLWHMVALRNRLLERVREIAPDYFWSIDSDMLPAEDALLEGLGALEGSPFVAMGMRTFMTPISTNVASKAQLINGRLRNRTDVPYGTHQVDVIMGAKLMAPDAYSVDYEFNDQGEDVGWSMAVARTGGKLGWCAEAKAKHVMGEKYLDRVDERVGF